jgi:hypothetical protein
MSPADSTPEVETLFIGLRTQELNAAGISIDLEKT